jgi:hypothetical protein
MPPPALAHPRLSPDSKLQPATILQSDAAYPLFDPAYEAHSDLRKVECFPQ